MDSARTVASLRMKCCANSAQVAAEPSAALLSKWLVIRYIINNSLDTATVLQQDPPTPCTHTSTAPPGHFPSLFMVFSSLFTNKRSPQHREPQPAVCRYGEGGWYMRRLSGDNKKKLEFKQKKLHHICSD